MLKNFRNSIVGLAVGDALGMPAEGMTREQIKNIYGCIEDYIPSPYGDLKAGEWTDDTEQMLILAESILNTIYFDPEDFADRLKRWYFETTSKRVGPTTRRAIYNLINGIPWSKSGIDSDSCGAAMRVTPVGLVYSFSLDLVEKYAELSAIVTHRNYSAIGAAVAVAVAVACNIRGFSLDELVEEVSKRVVGYDPLVAEKIEYAYEISDKDVDFAVGKIGNSISSFDSVPMAFYCFFAGKNFEESVKLAANCGGDTDSIAAISGSLKGSAGFEVPSRWLEGLKDVDRLLDVAEELYKLYEKIIKLY
ncbi:MAG: ADP-ribosylglycohydrolase family protein [Archaeoglobales archaeon]|nr:ADP-ribosylglycohydrolase family protein [Archaeoglobales archaeon]